MKKKGINLFLLVTLLVNAFPFQMGLADDEVIVSDESTNSSTISMFPEESSTSESMSEMTTSTTTDTTTTSSTVESIDESEDEFENSESQSNAISETSQSENTDTTESKELSIPRLLKVANDQYTTIQSDLNLYDNSLSKIIGTTKNYIGKTLKIVEQVEKNSKKYYQLETNQKVQIGYVEASKVTISTNAGGSYNSYGKYVTIKVKNYDIWGDFNWKKRNHSSDYYGKVVQARGYYNHYNGSRYLSLYDNKGKWIGYMNEKGSEITNNKVGFYQSYGKYVTIKVKNYDIWGDFNWKKRNHSSDYYGKVVQARGYYNHYNGSRYLSLYDNKGKWIGYMNEKGSEITNNQAGFYQSYSKYVTIKVKNYDIWGNFNWKKKNHSSDYYGKVLQARGYYEHYNGSRYLSLYDHKGKWIGYMNAKGTSVVSQKQGDYHALGTIVTIKSKNYDIWQNFIWKKKDTSNKRYHEDLNAKGIYYHFNGSNYLSLYDDKGKWVGYINENATNISSIRAADAEFERKYKGQKVHMFVMGHGGGDPGAIGSGINEANFTRNELLPYLQKYASKLKKNKVIFYDKFRNMYEDAASLALGSRSISNHISSVTELHLDSAGTSKATGGHVIVNRSNGTTEENLALAQTVKKYNSLWAGVGANGLSYRADLLNLNVLKRRNIPYRLIEMGFITNPNDVLKLTVNKDQLAKAMIENVTGEKL